MNHVNVDGNWPDVIDIYQVHLHRSSFMDHVRFTFAWGEEERATHILANVCNVIGACSGLYFALCTGHSSDERNSQRSDVKRLWCGQPKRKRRSENSAVRAEVRVLMQEAQRGQRPNPGWPASLLWRIGLFFLCVLANGR